MSVMGVQEPPPDKPLRMFSKLYVTVSCQFCP